MTVAAVVLAAGGSRRLGQPKQLLDHRGRTLVEHAIDRVRAAGVDTILVVVGAHAAQIGPLVEAAGAQPVVNERWTDGQGTSVAAGVRRLAGLDPTPESVLLTPCDLPHVDPDHLRRLTDLVRRGDADIAATRHGDAAGAPACFAASWFDRLADLSGDVGARSIIDPADPRVRTLEHPPARLDIDRPDHLDRLVP